MLVYQRVSVLCLVSDEHSWAAWMTIFLAKWQAKAGVERPTVAQMMFQCRILMLTFQRFDSEGWPMIMGEFHVAFHWLVQKGIERYVPKDHWTLETGYFEDPTPASYRFFHPSIGGSKISRGIDIEYLELNASQTQEHITFILVQPNRSRVVLTEEVDFLPQYGIIKQAGVGNVINQSRYQGCQKRT